MRCPDCYGKGLTGGLPCPECGGLGLLHCCEGLTEQPIPEIPTPGGEAAIQDPYPTVDESLDRLHRAGWSVGHTGGATLWLVSGSNGENAIGASGRSLAEAYWRACVQAREVGLLAPVRGRGLRDG